MDVAFHFNPAKNGAFQSRGQSERRLIGLLRLLADFSCGPVEVNRGVFSSWMLQHCIALPVNEQCHRARIEQAEFILLNRWQQEFVHGWHWPSADTLNNKFPDTDFMVVRNVSTQIAESICHGMDKRSYLQCAFEISRRSDLQSAIYYDLADRCYLFSSMRSAAYFLPSGAEDDVVAIWRLRRLGFKEIERLDDMPSMEDTFLLMMHLMDNKS
ncbi:MAG: hypothetical protein WAV95_05335 [Azonexus sp.]